MKSSLMAFKWKYFPDFLYENFFRLSNCTSNIFRMNCSYSIPHIFDSPKLQFFLLLWWIFQNLSNCVIICNTLNSSGPAFSQVVYKIFLLWVYKNSKKRENEDATYKFISTHCAILYSACLACFKRLRRTRNFRMSIAIHSGRVTGFFHL